MVQGPQKIVHEYLMCKYTNAQIHKNTNTQIHTANISDNQSPPTGRYTHPPTVTQKSKKCPKKCPKKVTLVKISQGLTQSLTLKMDRFIKQLYPTTRIPNSSNYSPSKLKRAIRDPLVSKRPDFQMFKNIRENAQNVKNL